MKKLFIIHPFLFAVFPILFLFAQNIEQTSFSDLLLPMNMTLGFTLFSLLIFGIFFRNLKKISIIISTFLILFFSYGHVFNLIDGWQIGDFIVGRRRYLLIAWAIFLFTIIYFTAKTQKKLLDITKILNIMAISMVIISLFNIVIYEFKDQNKNIILNQEVENLKITNASPDIYYIIFDGHTSSKTLKEIYNYDNSEFDDYLRKKGFYTTGESHSNFPHTDLSLSTSLNMEYVDKIQGVKSSGVEGLIGLIMNNKVTFLLKSNGYKIINYGSTADNSEYTDIKINCNSLNEFLIVLARTTVLSPFNHYLFKSDLRENVMCVFSELGKTAEIEGPKFIFAHLISPHAPYIFGRNGEEVEQEEIRINYWPKEKYLNQLIFIDKQIKILVDEILTKSKNPPIIILQSDHGSGSTFDINREKNWANPTNEMLGEAFGILNAYYFPDGRDKFLYNNITPVNTFRLIFNNYFGADYELLEDKSYLPDHKNYYNYYNDFKFIDITDRL